jgi:hypothetical protein
MIGTCDVWMFSRTLGLSRESVASSSAVETLFVNVYGAISHLSQRSAWVTKKGDFGNLKHFGPQGLRSHSNTDSRYLVS